MDLYHLAGFTYNLINIDYIQPWFLLLYNKPPQNLVIQNSHFVVVLRYVGYKFRKITAEMVCVYAVVPVPLAGMTFMAEGNLMTGELKLYGNIFPYMSGY